MFLLLALPDGTPEQLQKLQTKTVHAQILWIGENIKKRAIAANSVDWRKYKEKSDCRKFWL